MDRRGSATDGADGTGEAPPDADGDDDAAAVGMEGTWRPEDVPEMLPDRAAVIDADGPVDALDYAADVRDAAALDAAAAADHVDHLASVVRETTGDSRAAAAEALDLIGRRRPSTLAVWTDDLVALAADADPAAAAAGLRALVRLAEADPAAAAAGAGTAVDAAGATDARRRPALRLVAALAEADPEHVPDADRVVAAAMADADAGVRTAGALCAASVLAAAPGTFPRTATGLFELLDDADADVRAGAHLALVRFARDHPEQVPEKRAAVEALGRASDADLDLAPGATKDALTALLEVAHGYSF
ncbi:MAG: adaptin [Haloferacaceae archaeon]